MNVYYRTVHHEVEWGPDYESRAQETGSNWEFFHGPDVQEATHVHLRNADTGDRDCRPYRAGEAKIPLLLGRTWGGLNLREGANTIEYELRGGLTHRVVHARGRFDVIVEKKELQLLDRFEREVGPYGPRYRGVRR